MISIVGLVVELVALLAFALAALTGWYAWLDRLNRASDIREGLMPPAEEPAISDGGIQPGMGGLGMVLGILWEGVVNSILFLLYPLGLWDRDPKAQHETDPGGPVVLLVHGYLMNRGCWMYMQKRLQRGGIRNVFTVNLPFFGDIDDFSRLLGYRVDQAMALTGARQVTLVGHSQGGLISRAYAQRIAGDKVARVITVGTLHEGTRLGPMALGRNGRQLCFGNRWLRELNEGLPALVAAGKLSCIASRHDNLVVPYFSGIVRGIEGADNVVFDYVGHDSLLFSSRVHDQIVRRIEKK